VFPRFGIIGASRRFGIGIPIDGMAAADAGWHPAEEKATGGDGENAGSRGPAEPK
jgi:hypothetical protein